MLLLPVERLACNCPFHRLRQPAPRTCGTELLLVLALSVFGSLGVVSFDHFRRGALVVCWAAWAHVRVVVLQQKRVVIGLPGQMSWVVVAHLVIVGALPAALVRPHLVAPRGHVRIVVSGALVRDRVRVVWLRLQVVLVMVQVLGRVVLRLLVICVSILNLAFVFRQLRGSHSVTRHVVSRFDWTRPSIFMIEIVFVHIVLFFDSCVVVYLWFVDIVLSIFAAVFVDLLSWFIFHQLLLSDILLIDFQAFLFVHYFRLQVILIVCSRFNFLYVFVLVPVRTHILVFSFVLIVNTLIIDDRVVSWNY